MNCQSFEETVNELARDRILDQTMEANLREGVSVHLDECTACAVRLQDGRSLTRCLDELAREMKSSTTPAHIEEQLLQAYRQTLPQFRALQPAASRLPGRALGHRSHWLLAAAAVFLLVFGIVLLRSKVSPPSPRESLTVQTVESAQPRNSTPPDRDPIATGTESTPKSASHSNNNGALTSRKDRRRLQTLERHPSNRDGETTMLTKGARPATTENQTDAEIATQFIALSYTGPASLQDGGQIVRVEVPRSTMASFGLPVNMERYSERVKADVLLGFDGFPRAIRFVQ
jgi:hypothetical protein